MLGRLHQSIFWSIFAQLLLKFRWIKRIFLRRTRPCKFWQIKTTFASFFLNSWSKASLLAQTWKSCVMTTTCLKSYIILSHIHFCFCVMMLLSKDLIFFFNTFLFIILDVYLRSNLVSHNVVDWCFKDILLLLLLSKISRRCCERYLSIRWLIRANRKAKRAFSVYFVIHILIRWRKFWIKEFILLSIGGIMNLFCNMASIFK